MSTSHLSNPPKVILPAGRFHGDEDEDDDDGVWMRETADTQQTSLSVTQAMSTTYLYQTIQ